MEQENFVLLTAEDESRLNQTKEKLENAQIEYKLKELPRSDRPGFGSIVSSKTEVLVKEEELLKARKVIGMELSGLGSDNRSGIKSVAKLLLYILIAITIAFLIYKFLL